MLLLAGSALALELEEPAIQEQVAEVLPASAATNKNDVAPVVLIIEDLESTPAPVILEIQDANVTSETVAPVPAKPVHVPDHAGVLNNARQYALGMIETGNNDGAIGGLGEVSRYQLMPSVWKHYSTSRSYRNLDVATEVARQHWTSLYEYFKNKTEREPTNFDMYVLWNTRHGHYAGKEFTPARLSPVIRDRAQRFANLVEDSLRRESELAMANPR
jgi:hypothetical protein